MIINELEGKVKRKRNPYCIYRRMGSTCTKEPVIDLQANDVVHPILLGSPEQIQKCSEENGLDVSNIEQIDPLNYEALKKWL